MNEAYKQKIMSRRGIFAKLFRYLELKGLMYTVPFSATMEGWDTWRKKVQKEYPIQYFIREYIEDVESIFIRRWRQLKYFLRTLFFPENALIRNSIPKRGCDVTHLITVMNFAAILQFKEEADKSVVNWNDEHTEEFKKWLDSAVVWIKEGKANLEKKLDEAYPDIYLIRSVPTLGEEQIKDLYKEVKRLEELIEQTDENILVQMIKYRDYFWT